jgi:hypothetical protein
VNKRQREKKTRRVAGEYVSAQEKRKRLFSEYLARRLQQRADELVRNQYSIIG